ncbi:uncharacterized protein LOC131238985 [Magnolia sinica]|uniref:uncharacterized protein LOC131238985 n=1 Tax=Magnolia sinica TaxID=86752 RepID=UPI002659C20A|nr:uncharacterized protein LOC131238985 [Magnolia sinica]
MESKDFRPVSLIGGPYKIPAKMLDSRFRECISKVISENQGTFVIGRKASNLALIAHECIDSMYRERKSSLVCKLDIEKPYDHVDLNFLDYMLGRMGCSIKLQGWIKKCVRSASFSILVNRSPKGYYKGSCGLCQGDRLSPYLFVLVVEALSRMLKKGEENGLFTASGLKINAAKSDMLGVHVEPGDLSRMAAAFGCRTGSFLIEYLGLPLCLGKLTKHLWDMVIERIEWKLSTWRRYMSLGARLTLIKSAFSNMPLYFLSLFKCPKSILDKLEKLRRDFLWHRDCEGRKFHLLEWDEVCKRGHSSAWEVDLEI